MSRASAPFLRGPVRDAILLVLSRPGKSISQLESEKGRTYKPDGSQNEYANEPLWHSRSELLISAAKALKVHPSMWGERRTSSEFYNAADQEIHKLKKQGIIKDWSSSERFGIFRLGNNIGSITLEASMSGDIPRATDAPSVEIKPTEDNMRRMFLSILTKGKKDNTYKFALARVLLDYCMENRNAAVKIHEIPYRYLASRFLKYYWHQVYKFRIKQDHHTRRTPKLVQAINAVFKNSTIGDFERLEQKDVRRAEEKILRTVFGHARSKTSLVVPKFQKIPEGNTAREIDLFYKYDDDEKIIYLKPHAFEFFRDNYGILSKAVLAEWAKYLEKVNDSLPRLVAKIEQDNMERGALSEYRSIYLKHTCHCFYCLNRLERGLIHVDHFIPWSYIFEDSAWNLVLACQECNLKKSNSLPQADFCGELISRNKKYEERIKRLADSLRLLDAGRGWRPEIENHYTNCIEYGFNTVRLP